MSENTIELNTKSFDKETKKGKWIVDFWASWCVAPSSHIYTSPLNSKLASRVKSNDNIISFNNGINKDKIVHSLTTNMGGHCKRVITSTGRALETTDDHAFFTNRGWVAAAELTDKDKLSILPVTEPINFDGEDKILLDKKNFEFLRNDYKNLDRYLKELEEKGILPLKKDNSKLLILSRLSGSLFSDGGMYNNKRNNYREISFTLGQKRDVENVVNDLNSLGFSIIHISERNNDCEIEGRKFSLHTFKVKCLSTSLYLLFRVLGVPEGNKTNVQYNIPNWITDGELAIKKEFLSAYLGGDGPRISITVLPRDNKAPYNSIKINDIEFRKRIDLVDNGQKLANEIATLLKDFGVNMSRIFYEIDPYIRKDKTQTAIIHLSVASNFTNGFIISQKIGYAYCWQKQLISMYSGEFIREILGKRASWKKLHSEVMALAEKGFTYTKVSEIFKIDQQLAYQWIVKKNKPTVQKHYLKFDFWLKEATEGLKDGFIWEKVEKIQDVHLPEVQVIETERDHNFIANGFLVHNCGPCKIMSPHFDAAAKELKGKVNFGKVNVDDNSELANKFEIMSIPTILFIQDGEVVHAAVGAMNKDQILENIDNSFS